MKKIKLLSVALLSIVLLVGCSSEPEKNKATKTSEKQIEVTAEKKEITKSDFSGYSFKDGLLTSPDYDIYIDKTELGNSNGEDGLILWFTMKNKSQNNITPQDALSLFSIIQQDDTSEYELPTWYNYLNTAEALYPTYTENGEQVDDVTYEKNNKLQNDFDEEYGKKFHAELLPGKEVKTAVTLTLKNKDFPIFIKMAEPFGSETKSEIYKVNLK